MELKRAIEEFDHEEVINQIDGLIHKTDNPQLLDQLNLAKLVGLIKSRNLNRAAEFVKLNGQSLSKYENYDLISRYLLYKRERYAELGKAIEIIPEAQRKFEDKLLEAQALYKNENFVQSLSLYLDLYRLPQIEELSLTEEIAVNIMCLITFTALTETPDKLNNTLRQKIVDFMAYIMEKSSHNFELRETFINLVVLLLTLEKSEAMSLSSILGSDFNLIEAGENLILRIERSMNEDNDMQVEDQQPKINQLEGDKLVDYLTLFVLRTFIMQMKQQINWQANEIEELKSLLRTDRNLIKDQQLRVALICYLIFIETLSDGNLEPLLALIEEELKFLRKNSKVSVYLSRKLQFNKAVIHIHRHNVSEARRVLKQELQHTETKIDPIMLPIELTIFVKNKSYREFESKAQHIANSDITKEQHMQCVYYLFQLAFFYNLNNQKRYIEKFTEFLEQFFLPQLNLGPELRFLAPKVFAQFAKVVVYYILKNSTILARLKERVAKLVEYIEDPKTVAKIAEGFVEKRDFAVAESIYKALIFKNPANSLFISRLNYIYSIIDPEKIDEGTLPEFDIIKDFNTLRNLENDYMKTIKSIGDKPKIQQPEKKSTAIKKTKNRICWPQGFDPYNPGKRPDPERWLPKIERAKFKKAAIKKGQYTKTQGVTVSDSKTTELFKQQNSTANQKITKNKKNKKR